MLCFEYKRIQSIDAADLDTPRPNRKCQILFIKIYGPDRKDGRGASKTILAQPVYARSTKGHCETGRNFATYFIIYSYMVGGTRGRGDANLQRRQPIETEWWKLFKK